VVMRGSPIMPLGGDIAAGGAGLLPCLFGICVSTRLQAAARRAPQERRSSLPQSCPKGHRGSRVEGGA
jgi:hypothetical protein